MEDLLHHTAARAIRYLRDLPERSVAPHVDGEQIVYLGEVSDDEKRDLFANARAFLFPILWPEPLSGGFSFYLLKVIAYDIPIDNRQLSDFLQRLQHAGRKTTVGQSLAVILTPL